MLIIPGPAIALFTFPGVIAHEVAHRLFADLTHTPVYDVCYFRVGDPAGYVVHGPVDRLRSVFLISVGPLIVNTILCAVIMFPVVPVHLLDLADYPWIFIPVTWVGFSIGMHAFPSNQDMDNFVEAVHQANRGGLLRVVSIVFGGLFVLVNALRFFWIDAIYAIGVSLFLPLLCGLL